MIFAATATVNVEVSQQKLEGTITNAHEAECLMLYESPRALNIRGIKDSTSGIHVKVKNPVCAEGHGDLGCYADMAAKQHGLLFTL